MTPSFAPDASWRRAHVVELGRLRKLRSVMVLLGCATCWITALAYLAGGALGATGHNFVRGVSETSPGKKLQEPGALAIDHSTGRVFMADPGTGAIDIFSSSGVFEGEIGEGIGASAVAVDEETHDVYVAEPSSNVVLVFKPDEKGGYGRLSEWVGANTPEQLFGEVVGVAVDNSMSASDPHAGDVYVLDAAEDAVYVYKPKPAGPEEGKEGAFQGSLVGGKLEEPNAVAVDASTGRIYVADSTRGFIAAYAATQTFEAKLKGSGTPEGEFSGTEGEEGNVTGLAADEGALYVAEAERHVISQFNGTGEWMGWVTQSAGTPLLEPDGVAVASGGELYVADALAGALDIYGPPVSVPDASTLAASKIGKASATLNGAVNGDGKAAKYRFEYGPSEAYGQLTPVQSVGTGEEKIKVEVSGLQAGQGYHFRLITENENGQNVGADRQFETLPPVEGLSTGIAQGIQPSEATLTGALSPNGVDAHYDFEWGPDRSYGNQTATTDAGSGKEAVAAKATLTGLSPNTTYHFRLVGANSFGTTQGADAQFTTSGPPQISAQLATGITHEVATLNASVDPGELETTYRFQYGTTTSYGSETPTGKLSPGEVPVAVSASLTGLSIGTVYHYRLIAENAAGKAEEPDQTVQTVPPAVIEGTSALEVFPAEAKLAADVNPLGRDTTYYFQYGSQPCKPNPASCTDVPAAPGKDIGSGEEPVPVEARLEGLKAQTTYRYRVIAINALGTAVGPELTLTTPAGETPFALADRRAWEMVTPPNKHGAPVEALTREGGLILAAEDGNAITYLANGSIVEEPEGNRSPEQQQDISTRTPAGWVTQDIATPQTKAQGLTVGLAPEYQFFTPDLSSALVKPAGQGAEPPLAPGVTQATMYIRDAATGAFLPLVTEANVGPGTHFGGRLRFLGATRDLTHVIISSTVGLTGESAAPGLYEWAGGRLQLVSLLPGGTAASEAELGYLHVQAHAISNDGSRIIWTRKEENQGAGHLYLRDTAGSQTLQLDAAQGAAEPASGSAEFQSASSDGSKVFFTDKQQLTPDSTAQPTFPEKVDLYECDVAEEAGQLVCHLKDLSVDHNASEHAAVQGFLFGGSEDGSSVFFVAQGVLASNEDGNGEQGESGKDNLYELHFEDGSWSTTFIAQLSREDEPEWQGNGIADSAFLTARVSANGRYLAFMSNASPTGYDNRDATSGKRDEEVYLYDSSERKLTCVSCNPTGARPHGVFDTVEAGEGLGLVVDRRKVWAEAGREHWLAGNIPGWTAQSLVSALFQSSYLSDEGRLFFNSPDYLVPQARSGKESVYEYEPSGVGSCESPSGGCLSLISSGDSGREAAFLEATPTGNDVFFLTAAPLLPQDTDTAFDIYDARVCTQASPCLEPPTQAPPGCSTANGCRPAEGGDLAPLGASGSAAVTNVNLQTQRKQPPGTKAGHPKRLTRAQQLAKALKACKKLKSKKKRAACEAQARKKWGGKATPKRGRSQATRRRR